MQSFQELYERLGKAAIEKRLAEELRGLENETYDPHQLDCLLNPAMQASVIRIGECNCSNDEKAACAGKCLFDALHTGEDGNMTVNPEFCIGCDECVAHCRAKRLTESHDILPALDAVQSSGVPVYAMIAPAFINQFSNDVTPGKLRTAFKMLGFAGMVEVALFADILTLKEALEFDKNILNEKDYQLTSCCCPIWIAMIRRVYHELVPHVPGSVSPMAACGRSIKALHPEAKTVFIGPCIAKKAEAREKDIADSTDYVLTFREVQDIFDFAGIHPSELKEDERDHSSKAGRIYATTGGVSEAVQSTVKQLNPHRKIEVHAIQADGVPSCKAMLDDILKGKRTANFIEGMGCVGGCVGGPRALIPKGQGRENVFEYGNSAQYYTPLENPFVIELLHQLGFDSVESLLQHSDIFTRDF